MHSSDAAYPLREYVSVDADFTRLPPAATEGPIPMRHHGELGTRLSYVSSDQCTTWSITASNVVSVGPRIEGVRTDQDGCQLRRASLRRGRSLSNDEWIHLIWLVNLAQVENLSPQTVEEVIGSVDASMSFTMHTSEGDVRLRRASPHYEDDNFHYVLAYMRQLAGDGF
jgi:hypothetical protein